MDLPDFYLAPLRRVVKEAASVSQSIDKVFVPNVSFVQFSCAVARNAHKTADWVSNLSRTLCHGLMFRTWFALGRLW